jgi:hypothetical protein
MWKEAWECVEPLGQWTLLVALLNSLTGECYSPPTPNKVSQVLGRRHSSSSSIFKSTVYIFHSSEMTGNTNSLARISHGRLLLGSKCVLRAQLPCTFGCADQGKPIWFGKNQEELWVQIQLQLLYWKDTQCPPASVACIDQITLHIISNSLAGFVEGVYVCYPCLVFLK